MKDEVQRRSACPISCALDILGDKWTLLVIRDMVFMRKKHFREFRASMEGIASNILTTRLKKLETEGIISKQSDPNSGRQVIYTLTNKGKALIPVLVELGQWGAIYDDKADVNPEIKKRLMQDKEIFVKQLIDDYENSLEQNT